MGILDEIRALTGRKYACSLNAFFATLSPIDRTDLRAAFADRGVSSTAIVKVLQKRGFMNGEYVVKRHRSPSTECKACAENPGGLYAAETDQGGSRGRNTPRARRPS